MDETIKLDTVDTHAEMTDDVRCMMVTCDVTDTAAAAVVMDTLSDNLATAGQRSKDRQRQAINSGRT